MGPAALWHSFTSHFHFWPGKPPVHRFLSSSQALLGFLGSLSQTLSPSQGSWQQALGTHRSVDVLSGESLSGSCGPLAFFSGGESTWLVVLLSSYTCAGQVTECFLHASVVLNI